MSVYLLDTNVMLEARDSHYGFAFCPAFWVWIDQMHQAGLMYSVKRVKDELSMKLDNLSEWCNIIGEDFFLPESQDIKNTAHEVKTLISKEFLKFRETPFGGEAIMDFMNGADPHLIACGKISNYTVVTQEKNKKGKIKIPAVCENFGVSCMDIFEVLAKENPRFVLEGGSHLAEAKIQHL